VIAAPVRRAAACVAAVGALCALAAAAGPRVIRVPAKDADIGAISLAARADIVTNEFNAAPQVLISDLAQKKKLHWIEVALVGTASNRDGLGALVRVSTGGRVQTRSHDGKSGYLSQSALPEYFGLGGSGEVERVEVLWPSGRRSVVEKPKTNATLRIEEPRQ